MGESVQKQFGNIMAAARARSLSEPEPVAETREERPDWMPPRHPTLAEEREATRQRIEEKRASARRTRLHSFGLAGGRRG